MCSIYWLGLALLKASLCDQYSHSGVLIVYIYYMTLICSKIALTVRMHTRHCFYPILCIPVQCLQQMPSWSLHAISTWGYADPQFVIRHECCKYNLMGFMSKLKGGHGVFKSTVCADGIDLRYFAWKTDIKMNLVIFWQYPSGLLQWCCRNRLISMDPMIEAQAIPEIDFE